MESDASSQQQSPGSADDRLIFDPEHAPSPPPKPPVRREPGYADLLQGVVFALLSLGLCVVLGSAAVGGLSFLTDNQISPTDGATQLVVMLLIQGVWWAIVMAFLYFVLVVKYGIPFAEGLDWRPIAAKLPYIAGGFAMAIAVTALANVLPMPDEPSPLEALLEEAKRFLPLFVVFGVLIAPAVEEVVFRGFVFGVLERAHGAAVAVVATAALFAAPHSTQYGGRWQILLILFLVGIALGIVRLRTGSTLATTYLHAAYNATFMLALIAAEIAPESVNV